MTPADVPDALAHALAEALNRYETSGLCPLRGACELCDCGADMQTPERQEEDYRRALDRARDGLAAVLPEIQAQAQQDLITDLLARDLWDVRYALNEYPIQAVPKSALLERRNRLARLTTTTEEPTT